MHDEYKADLYSLGLIFLEILLNMEGLEEKQINDYIDIADEYNIPKLITVSNQFVSHTTQSPLMIRRKKKVDLYHLSWSYIRTIALILSIGKGTNIANPDQIEIMKEVVDYFEYEKSGIRGFTDMKEGWKNTAEKINKGEKLKKTDMDIIEAAESWLQEEKDMALILSRELGLLVSTGGGKYKEDLDGRIKNETENIINNKAIESILKVSGAASNITVRANFLRRNIEFSTNLIAPQDKATIKGQIGWVRNQIEKFKNRNPELFEQLEKNVMVEFKVKNYGTERMCIKELDNFADKNKGKTLTEYGVILCYDMGRTFGHKSNSIKSIEKLLLDYYEGIVQHLTKWQIPAPEIKNREIIEESE